MMSFILRFDLIIRLIEKCPDPKSDYIAFHRFSLDMDIG